jgi:hypothetical protein
MQTLTCPSCAASANFTPEGVCKNCQTQIIKGEQQWYVKERYIVNRTVLGIGNLLGYTPEEGTDLPTMISLTLAQEISLFERQYEITWSNYWDNFQSKIVQRYFLELNIAWTNRSLDSVRQLLSTDLYETNKFLIELYHQYDLTNRVDDLQIGKVQLARIDIDPYYAAITARIFASCFDYTLDRRNNMVAGSNKIRRNYSEYWTFTRKIGNVNSQTIATAPANAIPEGAVYERDNLQNNIDDAWVLSLITQDENYFG